MYRLTVGICLIGFVLAQGVVVRAAEPAGGEHDKHEAKYIVGVHGPKGEEEKKYDLAKSEDRQALYHDLEAGNVHELKKDQPPDLFMAQRWDLGIWSIIIFVLLLLGLSKFAWKPMIAGLNKREQNIRGALEQAEKTRREAMELQSQLDAKMRDAGGEIARMMDSARRDASAVKDQMVAEARAQIQQDRDRQLREIEAAKSKAMQDMWQQSVALATAISAKVVRRKLSEEDHRRLLDESLAELKQYAGTVRHA
jgi:F-type H+-transporting ATPase subunit b